MKGTPCDYLMLDSKKNRLLDYCDQCLTVVTFLFLFITILNKKDLKFRKVHI